VTQQSFIPPTHFVRGGQVHQHGLASAHYSFGFVFSCTLCKTPQQPSRAEGVMPDGGARSATLERMSALSRRWVVRETISSRTTPG